MAIDMDVYFLYELKSGTAACSNPEHILLKVLRPAWRNAVEPEAEAAETVMEQIRDEMLRQYLVKNGGNATLIGKMEGWPEGEDFYQEQGGFQVDFWLAQSEYGQPWVALSQAADEESFWKIIQEDDMLAGIRPVPPAQQVRALFLTEKDFSLSI
ncbi:MAG: hypothetical protein H6Q72_4943 [Firmicutes bacterium]|nr:hypothetical protein [Bacillota bacterium]